MYPKEKLIDSFIKDIKRLSYGTVTIDRIQLDLNISRIIFYGDVLVPKTFVSNINDLWKNKLFEGTSGYFIFGDIINKTVITTTYLQFPFMKINYVSYFDMLPMELNFKIIEKLANIRYDIYSLPRFLQTYPLLTKEENSFKLLISKKFPWLYDDLLFIIDNSSEYDKKIYTWDKIYTKLIKEHPAESIIQDAYGETQLLSYFLKPLIVTVIIKRKYSGIYYKFYQVYNLKQFDDLYNELENIHPEHVFWNYTQTAKFDENFKFSFRDIYMSGLYRELLKHMIFKDNLQFVDELEELRTLEHITNMNNIRYYEKDVERLEKEAIQFIRDVYTKEKLEQLINFEIQDEYWINKLESITNMLKDIINTY